MIRMEDGMIGALDRPVYRPIEATALGAMVVFTAW
jgi:hypothetical protein